MIACPAPFDDRRGLLRLRAAAGVAAAFFALLSRPVIAQTLGHGIDDGISPWRVAGALLLCVVLAVAGAVILKYRMGYRRVLPFGAKASRRLRLVESLRFSHQIDLCIVDCDGRELLVLASAQGAQFLESPPRTQAAIASPPGT